MLVKGFVVCLEIPFLFCVLLLSITFVCVYSLPSSLRNPKLSLH